MWRVDWNPGKIRESRQDSGLQARCENPGESQGIRGLVLSFEASECLMFYGYVYDGNVLVYSLYFYFIKDSRVRELSRFVSSSRLIERDKVDSV